MKNEKCENILEIANRKSAIVNLLAWFYCCRLRRGGIWRWRIIFIPVTRWIGLWNNPNIYGMLMGTGGGARNRAARGKAKG